MISVQIGVVTKAPLGLVLSVMPALAALAALAGVASIRRNVLWMVPGWLASIALAPVIATFFGVRTIFDVLRGLTVGSVAVLAAGLRDATLPLVWTSYLACGFAIVIFIVALRALQKSPRDETDDAPKSTMISAAVIATTFVALGTTGFLFHDISRRIIDAMTRDQLSQFLASRLTITGAIGILMTLVLIATIVMCAVMKHPRPPRRAIARLLVFVSALAIVAFATSALVHRNWSAKLYVTAMTGRFPR